MRRDEKTSDGGLASGIWLLTVQCNYVGISSICAALHNNSTISCTKNFQWCMMLVLMAIFYRLNLFETINYYQRRIENNYYRWKLPYLQFINKQLPGTHSNQTQTHHGNNHNRGNQIKTNSLINFTINRTQRIMCLLLLKKLIASPWSVIVSIIHE